MFFLNLDLFTNDVSLLLPAGGIPWMTILPITIGLALVAVLALLYFCKCCGNITKENNFLKKMLVVAHPSQIGSDGNKPGVVADDLGVIDWQQRGGERPAAASVTAQVGAGRKPNYQRSCSKESSEEVRRMMRRTY